jgi:hypothetical protein
VASNLFKSRPLVRVDQRHRFHLPEVPLKLFFYFHLATFCLSLDAGAEAALLHQVNLFHLVFDLNRIGEFSREFGFRTMFFDYTYYQSLSSIFNLGHIRL